jgi:ABC-type proline/glycine betaine transport system permease subunit
MQWTRRAEIMLAVGFPLLALLAYLLFYALGGESRLRGLWIYSFLPILLDTVSFSLSLSLSGA